MRCALRSPICMTNVDPDYDDVAALPFAIDGEADDSTTLYPVCIFCARWTVRHPFEASVLAQEKLGLVKA